MTFLVQVNVMSRIGIIHLKLLTEYFAKYTRNFFLSFFPKLLLFSSVCM